MRQCDARWRQWMQDGARGSRMVQEVACYCKMVQDGATRCHTVNYHAITWNSIKHHAIPCNTMWYHAKLAVTFANMQYHVNPCNTVEYYAITCNTMQYHAVSFRNMHYYWNLYDNMFRFWKYKLRSRSINQNEIFRLISHNAKSIFQYTCFRNNTLRWWLRSDRQGLQIHVAQPLQRFQFPVDRLLKPTRAGAWKYCFELCFPWQFFRIGK